SGNLRREDVRCRGARRRGGRGSEGPMTSVAQAGERIEELLASLRARDGTAADAAEELVRLLVGLYGDGLAAIMAALAGEGAAGRAIVDRLPADPLGEGLLLRPGLPPLDTQRGVRRRRA